MRERLRRLWEAPLWAHVVLLAVILLALVPVVGVSSSLSPDEPIVITQARSLASGDGWVVEHPFAEIDPEDEFYPLAGSNRGADGIAPFAKHPVYPLVLAALQPVGGVAAMMVLSVLGTVAAAGLAALLAREVVGGRERPVLWAVGVASPLLFDAYLIIAHSVGAALVTAAVLAMVHATRRERPALLLAVATVLMIAAVFLRTEALIFALAAAVAVSTVGVVRRRPVVVSYGLVMGVLGVVAAALEKQLQASFIGGSSGTVAPPAIAGSFLGARVQGFLNTWLRPTADLPAGSDLLLVIVTVLAVAAVVVLRCRPGRPQMLSVLGAAAAALVAVAVLAEPDRVVPGLLVAYPLAVFGIGLVDRTYFRPSGRLLLTVTAGLFMAGVLATQYPQGGSAEWGGRYFALAMPILTVLTIDALARRAPALPVPVRRWTGGALVACSAVLALGAVVSLAQHHANNERLLARMDRTGASTTPGDGGAPVVVTSWPNIARHAWPNPSGQRWLYNPDEEMAGDLISRLTGVGVTELLFVGQDAEEVQPYLGAYDIDPERSFDMGKWEVSVLVAKP